MVSCLAGAGALVGCVVAHPAKKTAMITTTAQASIICTLVFIFFLLLF
jgi:hypothetical protein